jgi:hypothetical protein
MTRARARALCALTDALHQRAMARLCALRDEEARLRAALARLDAQARAARGLPQEALGGMRGIGADIAWQGWLARHRAAVQAELARVLARREQAMPAQRRAFGKAEAARALRSAAEAGARQARASAQAARLDDLAALARIQRATGSGPDQVS